jgi:hypothetical protein
MGLEWLCRHYPGIPIGSEKCLATHRLETSKEGIKPTWKVIKRTALDMEA